MCAIVILNSSFFPSRWVLGTVRYVQSDNENCSEAELSYNIEVILDDSEMNRPTYARRPARAYLPWSVQPRIRTCDYGLLTPELQIPDERLVKATVGTHRGTASLQ